MLSWLLLTACTPKGVPAIYDAARPEHYFDVPFPSDALLDVNGHPDLEGYPQANSQIANNLLAGWKARIEQTTVGFGNNTGAYFRFAEPIDVPATTAGSVDDGFLWIDLDEPELLPLELRFVQDPFGDPAYGPNTLAMAPQLGHPPRSGHRYAAVVMRSAGVAPPEDFEVDPDVEDALKALDGKGKVAIATVFTVQDATGQLRALAADMDSRIGNWDDVTLRRVTSLRYEQGETASGNESTLAISTFEDGTTRTAYLEPGEDLPAFTVDFDDAYPMVVYEADIPVLNYQGLADRPFMSPGLSHIGDNAIMTGWIDFEGDRLVSVPEVELMRITVSMPKDSNGDVRTDVPFIIYDHGTSGHAYNIVHRRNPADNGIGLTQAFADAGFAVIGRDATLYGTRFPLIDQGYGGSLGFYNVVNTPAFRDNQRQTALEGLIARRYAEQALNGDLPQGSVDPARARRMGHSLGAVTSNLGSAMAPEAFDATFLSGTGGDFILYFFETGLLDTIDPGDINLLLTLLGASPPDGPITTEYVFAAALGLDEQASGQLDRLHPAASLFSWQMDPSDPMAVARDETLPITVHIAPGDYQTPDFTAEALANALPQSNIVYCQAQSDYDPHNCLWREQEGLGHLIEWLNTDF